MGESRRELQSKVLEAQVDANARVQEIQNNIESQVEERVAVDTKEYKDKFVDMETVLLQCDKNLAQMKGATQPEIEVVLKEKDTLERHHELLRRKHAVTERRLAHEVAQQEALKAQLQTYQARIARKPC